MKKSYEMNMCEGAIFSKLCIFAFPLMLSSILQLLFNAADVIVVGRFSGSQALAAVGATTSLIQLIVNLFLGISIGTNVITARYYGAQDSNSVHQTVHTSILIAAVGGFFMIFVGILASRPVLSAMGTPDNVLSQSVLYMSIYFIGMPAFMVYNFGAAILRAIGDTRRPLLYLTLSGILNVILNLFFVILIQMGVAGVALATIISQYLSAGLILRCLNQSDGIYRLDFKKLHIYKEKLIEMLRIGIAAGFQGVVFNFSNVLIQSSVNSFGSLVMAGNTAASNIEGFVYVSMNSITQTALSFTSQNYGAGRYDRIDKILIRCIAFVGAIGLIMGGGAWLFGNQLLSLYTSEPQVITYGVFRLSIICSTYFICGIMDVFTGTIRGLGYSVLPMVVSLLGACAFRIIWIFTIFQVYHSTFTLYISYPISWVLTATVHLLCYLWIRRKIFFNTKDSAALAD